jgi:hypothetical protein
MDFKVGHLVGLIFDVRFGIHSEFVNASFFK